MFLQCLCWDTDPSLGEDSNDRPFTNVQVSISGPTTPPAQPTNGSGVVTFEWLTPGDYTVSVTKTGFTEVTDDIAANNPIVSADVTVALLTNPYPVAIGPTTKAVRVMRRQDYVPLAGLAPGAKPSDHGLECSRKHAKAPGDTGRSRSIAIPILWVWEEPWVMILRDVLWLGFLATMVAGLATGEYALAAWAGAYVGYLTTVIFGAVPGVIAMVLAFAGFVAAVISAVMGMLMHRSPSSLWIAVCFAAWTGFTWALARGRRPEFYNSHKDEIYIGGALGAIAGLATFFVFGGSLPGVGSVGDVLLSALIIVLILLFGFVCGALAALFSHVFTNDNNLEDPLVWQDGYHLPFAGEHYCVQGHRGFISHAVENADQEFSYDWEFPEGTPILSSKEGHVVLSQNGRTTTESNDGAMWKTGNDQANWLMVRHFDETVAHYLHLKKGGITELNPTLMTAIGTKPVHVHVGQQLGGAGNVGISMFSHLHYMVDHAGVPPDGTAPAAEKGERRPLKFVDGDTARHDQRCYSMRLYKSDTKDLGPIVMTAEFPPFRPGGSPTDGTQFPAQPPSPAAGGSGLPSPPAPPAPPLPPAPSMPPVPGGPGAPPVPGI